MVIIRHVTPRFVGGSPDETYLKIENIPADEFGRPNVNPPNIVIQDNLTLYSFTVNTDNIYAKFPIPSDLYSGDIEFSIVWTNDGGVDDNNRTVRWRLDYQTAKETEQVSGSHANSPKNLDDTYIGSTGWIEHHTSYVSINQDDFKGKDCIYLNLSAVTPLGSALTAEPHLIGVCRRYTAKRVNYSS